MNIVHTVVVIINTYIHLFGSFSHMKIAMHNTITNQNWKFSIFCFLLLFSYTIIYHLRVWVIFFCCFLLLPVASCHCHSSGISIWCVSFTIGKQETPHEIPCWCCCCSCCFFLSHTPLFLALGLFPLTHSFRRVFISFFFWICFCFFAPIRNCLHFIQFV